MADHVRQQIRERIGTTLTGLTTTGSNVFQSRVYPLEDSNLPALLIYTKVEESMPIDIGAARTMERNLTVNIEGYVKANSNFDDTIDTICKEVETAMASDVTVNGLAKDSFLEATEIEYNAEGEKPVGYVTMSFKVDYYVLETSPDVAR
tara:strand:+ start:859 stop:1305 length:447 start_codon:yes stop_codon:yes gene_type:complete